MNPAFPTFPTSPTTPEEQENLFTPPTSLPPLQFSFPSFPHLPSPSSSPSSSSSSSRCQFIYYNKAGVDKHTGDRCNETKISTSIYCRSHRDDVNRKIKEANRKVNETGLDQKIDILLSFQYIPPSQGLTVDEHDILEHLHQKIRRSFMTEQAVRNELLTLAKDNPFYLRLYRILHPYWGQCSRDYDFHIRTDLMNSLEHRNKRLFTSASLVAISHGSQD